jgi:transposase
MADHACDTHAIRQQIQRQGAVPNIPPKRNRPWKCCFSPLPAVAATPSSASSGCLKDFRRVATRYNRLATNLLAAVHLAATVDCWL